MGAWANFNNTNRSRCTFVGADIDVRANDVTIVGFSGDVAATGAIGIGSYTDIDAATEAIGVGYLSRMTNAADYSVLIGSRAYAEEAYSVGIGYNDTIAADYAVVIGTDATVMEGDSGIAIGAYAHVDTTYGIAIGGGSYVGGVTYCHWRLNICNSRQHDNDWKQFHRVYRWLC